LPKRIRRPPSRREGCYGPFPISAPPRRRLLRFLGLCLLSPYRGMMITAFGGWLFGPDGAQVHYSCSGVILTVIFRVSHPSVPNSRHLTCCVITSQTTGERLSEFFCRSAFEALPLRGCLKVGVPLELLFLVSGVIRASAMIISPPRSVACEKNCPPKAIAERRAD